MWHLLKFLMLPRGLWAGGCTQSFLPQTITQTTDLPAPNGWYDGSYTGVSDGGGDVPTPQFIRATVDVSHGKIVTLRIHQPPGWSAPQEPELLLRRALDQSTLDVDTSPPVGNESDQLLRALDDALSKARLSSPTTQ